MTLHILVFGFRRLQAIYCPHLWQWKCLLKKRKLCCLETSEPITHWRTSVPRRRTSSLHHCENLKILIGHYHTKSSPLVPVPKPEESNPHAPTPFFRCTSSTKWSHSFKLFTKILGRTMVQAINRRSLTAKGRTRSKASPCGTCGG
jgi:hypothetical protein